MIKEFMSLWFYLTYLLDIELLETCILCSLIYRYHTNYEIKYEWKRCNIYPICFYFSWFQFFLSILSYYKTLSRITSLEKEHSRLIEEYESVVKDLKKKQDETFENLKKEKSAAASKVCKISMLDLMILFDKSIFF